MFSVPTVGTDAHRTARCYAYSDRSFYHQGLSASECRSTCVRVDVDSEHGNGDDCGRGVTNRDKMRRWFEHLSHEAMRDREKDPTV